MARLLGGSGRTARAEIDNVVEHAAGLRSVADACRILRRRPAEVLELIDRGAFPDAFRVDGHWRIPLEDIRRVLLFGMGGGRDAPVRSTAPARRRRPHEEPGAAPAWRTPAERCELIARKIAQHGAVRISALSAELGVSQMTVRRDLDKLAAGGRLVRTYGGALAPGTRTVPPEPSRMRTDKHRSG
jgi:hypothetical protein